MELIYKVKKDDLNITINDVLSNEFELSNRLKNKLIKNKKVYLNNEFADTRTKINYNDFISIDLSNIEDNSNIVPTQMDLDIIYEDDWFLVINKPANLATHPSSLHYSDSLSNGVKFYFDKLGLKKKIRPVNRLDLNTSGIVIFAKCEYIQEQFAKQMVNKTFKKKYICFVSGILEHKKGKIDFPIARKPNSIIERCIDQNGKTCVTHYKALQEFEDYSLVECELETGRTHQIRVHFSAIGHPLLGDSLYGNESNFITRQALHSYIIELVHPISNKIMEFKCDIPYDMKSLMK